jgi:hypothetical protein
MTWPGDVRVSGYSSGRYGAPVRLGETVVPRVATFEVTGQDGAPDALVRFEVRDGRPECTEITVKTKPDGRGIRSADMALFNIDALAANVFAEVAMRLEPNPSAPDRESVATRQPPSDREYWAMRGDIESSRASRRGAPSRSELEKVARIYREHLSSAPVQALMALEGYTEGTARRRVQQARKAGLLPSTTPGKKKA